MEKAFPTFVTETTKALKEWQGGENGQNHVLHVYGIPTIMWNLHFQVGNLIIIELLLTVKMV